MWQKGLIYICFGVMQLSLANPVFEGAVLCILKFINYKIISV